MRDHRSTGYICFQSIQVWLVKSLMERGIAFGDPQGGELQRHQIRCPSGFFVLFQNLLIASNNRFFNKTKNPQQVLRVWSDAFGGERGIRTPGPPIGGQRFSRPPHSTALPFLHFSISPFLRRKDNNILILRNFCQFYTKYQIIKTINYLLTGF